MNITQKEEFRYQYAGMAMQAMIKALIMDKSFCNDCVDRAKDLGYKNVKYFIVEGAVEYADLLIEELEKPNVNNQTIDNREHFSDPYEECLHLNKGGQP